MVRGPRCMLREAYTSSGRRRCRRPATPWPTGPPPPPMPPGRHYLADLADALEAADHALSLGEWADLLLAADPAAYRERREPAAAASYSLAQRLALLGGRARRGVGLFAAGDVIVI